MVTRSTLRTGVGVHSSRSRLAVFALLLCLSSLALIACGPPPKPAELSQLETMRNDSFTGEISVSAPQMLEEADKFYKMATNEWQDGELERAREYAWLGQLRYKTAEAQTRQKSAQTRLETTRRELEQQTQQVELLNLKIESTQKSIAQLEQTISAVGDKAALQARGAVETQILGAEAEREKARAMQAAEHAAGLFNRGEAALKLAREHLAAGRNDDATKNAEEARAAFVAAAEEARPVWEKTQASARVNELFELAKQSFGSNALQDSRGIVVVFPGAFDQGKATMFDGQRRTLDKIAEIANAYPTATVMVEGYTQSKGDESKNLSVSEARANQARDYLVQQGVEPARMTATGYGEANPRYDNKARGERDKNDRIEIVFVLKK